MNDGRSLENLVAFVEGQLLPPGFEVKANSRVLNDEGVQVAELDIEIRGKVGSTTIAWLIECRDRPSQGPAPASWIEQLVGRRARFGFSKVTAVSTTGFAPGARGFAAEAGIELRGVTSIDASALSPWLQITSMKNIRRVHDLHHAEILLASETPMQLMQEALQGITLATGHSPLLHLSQTGEVVSMVDAFVGAVHCAGQANGDLFEAVHTEHPRRINLTVDYAGPDHFSIATSAGFVSVRRIDFFGELRKEEEDIPLVKTMEYRHSESGETISQLAAFAPQAVLDMQFVVELHRLADTGETVVAMRRTG